MVFVEVLPYRAMGCAASAGLEKQVRPPTADYDRTMFHLQEDHADRETPSTLSAAKGKETMTEFWWDVQ